MLPGETSRGHHGHGLAQGHPCEVLQGNGFREEKTLGQIEAHFAHNTKIRNRFHALGHRAGATAVRKFEYSVAHSSLQPVVGTTGDKFSINFELDEWKLAKSDE